MYDIVPASHLLYSSGLSDKTIPNPYF